MSRRRTIIRLSAVLASLAFVWACGDDSTTGADTRTQPGAAGHRHDPGTNRHGRPEATLNVASFFLDPGGLEAAQSASVTVEQGNQAPPGGRYNPALDLDLDLDLDRRPDGHGGR